MIGIYYFINFKYVDTRWNRQSINTIDQYLTFVSLFVPAFSYAFSLSNANDDGTVKKGKRETSGEKMLDIERTDPPSLLPL